MSQDTYPGGDLDWDLVDRLNKSLRVSRKSVAEVATALGVHRNTVTNYLSGRVKPDRRTQIAWAFAVGLPLDWLAEGKLPPPDGPDDGARNPLGVVGTPTGQYGDLPTNRLLHLPDEPWLIAAQTPPTSLTLTKSSTDLAA